MHRRSTAFGLLLVLFGTGGSACAETFQLKREGGVLALPVRINHNITLNFTIDSGASDVVIPEDVFSTLSRTGTITPKDMLASGTYILADGTRHQSRRFRIQSLEIGGLELKDIAASVAPSGGPLLLGQSFLSHLSGWSIDNRRDLLIVGDAKNAEAVGSPSLRQPSQSDALDKTGKWLLCSQPFAAKIQAGMDYQNQLAIVYPRFGLLWNEWMHLVDHCGKVHRQEVQGGGVTESDSRQCSSDAMKLAHRDFVNSVAASAEPQAVQGFNQAQLDYRQATSDRDRACGSL